MLISFRTILTDISRIMFDQILVLRESFPRQVDKKSRGPQGERIGILKEEERTNFLLFFLYIP